MELAATKREVIFSCYALNAHFVCLAGSFNEWNPDSLPLQHHNDGNWTITLSLAPGRYEYKFVVDGTWCCKPGCHEIGTECVDCVRNDFDTMNRVLIVV